MRVLRTQWPVGQGCFASGIIDAEGEAPIHYVYDCGARNLSHLGSIVSRYAERVDKLDALFVSHLDGDHVDGLDLILATLSPTEVYLPYLDMADRVQSIMEQDAAGRLTASFVQAQLDPASWFGSRGVGRIIFVRNGGDIPEDGFRPPEGGGEGPGPGPGRPLRLECSGTTLSSDHGPTQASGPFTGSGDEGGRLGIRHCWWRSALVDGAVRARGRCGSVGGIS